MALISVPPDAELQRLTRGCGASKAWLALYGDFLLRDCKSRDSLERWEQGLEGIESFNHDNKVVPMRRAMNELSVGTWFSGLRRNQSSSRAETPFVQHNGGRFKVAPIADWTDRDIYTYLTAHKLPYHPLWHKGYVSIGDIHTTVPLHEANSAEETRFMGLKRECGLHDSVI